jgi:hypothetical protein
MVFPFEQNKINSVVIDVCSMEKSLQTISKKFRLPLRSGTMMSRNVARYLTRGEDAKHEHGPHDGASGDDMDKLEKISLLLR